MAKKLTLEFVKKAFFEEGYELISNKYINSSTPLRYKCPNGHKYQVSWNKWKLGRRCPFCSDKGRVRNRTISDIKNEMAVEGYKLLSTEPYKHSKQKLRCECPNGHIFVTTWDAWKYKKNRCSICSGNNKLTIAYVRKKLESEGYVLLSDTYTNAHGIIEYKCNNGHKGTTTWANWYKGNRCPVCSGKKKHSISFIRSEFNKEHYKLLVDRYDNCKQKLEFVCDNGHKHEITWNNWTQGQRCYKCSCTGVSKDELEILSYIKEFGFDVIERDRELIKPYELDIVIPDICLAIEYCGLYWHSELCGKDSRYHIKKLNLCNDRGYRLITIFEDEYLDHKELVLFKLALELGRANSKVIYARNTKVCTIPTYVAKSFCNSNHLQGYAGASIKLGLFYGNELVAVMTFSKPSIAKGSKGESGRIYELNRFCTKHGYRVVGAASKLLSNFMRLNKCDSVFSYADRRWSDGKLYNSVGFTLAGISKPNYWYIKDGRRFHRFSFRKRSDEPKDISEWELRKHQGYNRIWDCGNLKFELKI